MEEHVKMASTLTAASVWLVMKAETVKVKILNSFKKSNKDNVCSEHK